VCVIGTRRTVEGCDSRIESVRTCAASAANSVDFHGESYDPATAHTGMAVAALRVHQPTGGFAMGRTIGAAIGAVIVVMFLATLIEKARTPAAQLHVTVSARR
jgi:hypothetical protein